MNYEHLDTLVGPTVSKEIIDTFMFIRPMIFNQYDEGHDSIIVDIADSFYVIYFNEYDIENKEDLNDYVYNLTVTKFIGFHRSVKYGWEIK